MKPYLGWSAIVCWSCICGIEAQQMRQASNVRGKSQVSAGLVVQDLTEIGVSDLVSALAAQGLLIQNPLVTGAPEAVGVFQGGVAILGLEDGLVLSTGCAKNVIGPNSLDDISCDNGTPGDGDLQTQVPLFPTFDAAALEFDVQGGPATRIQFEYVFGSDEYNEFVGGAFNDVFGIFVNGVNITTLPGSPQTPVSIASVNCGQPYAPPLGGSHCALYVNNDLSDGGGAFNTEMDGLTVVLTATGTLVPGTNHIKIAIADAGDRLVDSDVFVRMKGPVFTPATPCEQTLSVNVGRSISIPIGVASTTGAPGASAQLIAAGVPPGAFHSPPLPVTGQPATTTLTWVPTDADIGPHTIAYTGVDEGGVGASCTVTIDVQCTGKVATYGVGTPGTGGIAPVLTSSCASTGAVLTMSVQGGLPGAHGCIGLGLVPDAKVIGGATILVQPFLAFAHNLDVAGGYTLALTVPTDPALVGSLLYMQAVYMDPGSSGGLSSTSGLRVTIGG